MQGIVVCAFLALLSPSFAAPQVRIGNTVLTGLDVPLLHQEFFGGIPFAESPVGERRLQPPILKTQLDVQQFDASHFGFACPQPGVPTEFLSEDCLTINVFRPAGLTPASKLPVMFWTYGGRFQFGASAVFNGSAIVAQSVARGTPVIYVNFNYRLGPLGFPQGKEADRRHALNLGIKDQIAALKWVQYNIGYFGGDDKKVTAFGESAGSMMTSILFLKSNIKGLARAAIFESGQANSPPIFHAERREVDWQVFVRSVPSCASLATTGNTLPCLQAANSSDIIQGLVVSLSNSPESFPWNPVLDGPGGVVPDYASRLFAKGEVARLPFIAGTNLDEGTIVVAPPAQQLTSANDIAQNLIANFSPPVVSPQSLASHVQKILQLYPDNPALGSPFNTGNNTFGLGSTYKRWAAILGDIVFQSQRRFWSKAFSNAGIKTYGYLFTEPQTSFPPALGVPHMAELPFVYGNVSQLDNPSSRNLSTIMIDYWVSFATSLDPNDGCGNSRPIWQPYTPKNQAVIQLNSHNLGMIRDDYRKEQIGFINSDPLVWLH